MSQFSRWRCPVIGTCLIAGLLLTSFWETTRAGGDSGEAKNPKDRKTAPQSKPGEPVLERSITMKTLGGRQFWADVAVFHDWRIQKNVLTGHYRLLDGEDYRHATGTLQECRDKLEEIKAELKLPPMQGKAVIVIHGIVRSSRSFEALSKRLEQEGYHVFRFDYASTRISIPAAAEDLHRVVESLDGIKEINFVVHSMGGLVVRSYLAEHKDPRIKRMVMLGVPNLGASLATRLHDNALYRLVYGPAGQQLVQDPDGFIAGLPTPDFEFAIIAGARGTLGGFNPLVPGDDDGTVSVSSTRLPGAADFMTVRCLHPFLMKHGPAIDATVHFLKTGALRDTGDPHPIPSDPEVQTQPQHNQPSLPAGDSTQ